jgi:hypothetical protein
VFRRFALILAVTAVAAGVWFAVHQWEARDVALAASQQHAWSRLETDLKRRCVPPAKRPATAVAHDRRIDGDVTGLIAIARANPHAWFPNPLGGSWKGVRVSWALSSTADGLGCGRPDLVARLYTAAGQLPGAFTPTVPPAVQATFTEAWADLQVRCAQAARGSRIDRGSVAGDVSTMIDQDAAVPAAHLFASVGLASEPATIGGVAAPTAIYAQPTGRCGAPAAIAHLAAALGRTPDSVMYGGTPPADLVHEFRVPYGTSRSFSERNLAYPLTVVCPKPAGATDRVGFRQVIRTPVAQKALYGDSATGTTLRVTVRDSGTVEFTCS